VVGGRQRFLNMFVFLYTCKMVRSILVNDLSFSRGLFVLFPIRHSVYNSFG
jgi:hypothetical protein